MDIKIETQKNKTPVDRKKRVKKIKKLIILIVALLIIIPTILCILLIFKVNSLQSQIDMLMIDKYGVTYAQLHNTKDLIVHAAPSIEMADAYNGITQEVEDYKEDANLILEESQNLQATDIKDKYIESDKKEIDEILDDNRSSIIDKENLNNNLTYEKEDQDSQETVGPKRVYLTFDDGPSINTPKILDILQEYDVKATFFVIGKTDEFSKDMYKRIVDEGHSIGLHSYSHRYDQIYESVESFEDDLLKLSDLIYENTNHKPDIYRFPGGSGNQVSDLDMSVFIQAIEDKGITYFDWNVANGDGSNKYLSPEESYRNIMDGVKIFNNSIVLMHDSYNKISTVESLPKIIEALLENHVEILPLTNQVKPVQQIKISDIN